MADLAVVSQKTDCSQNFRIPQVRLGLYINKLYLGSTMMQMQVVAGKEANDDHDHDVKATNQPEWDELYAILTAQI